MVDSGSCITYQKVLCWYGVVIPGATWTHVYSPNIGEQDFIGAGYRRMDGLACRKMADSKATGSLTNPHQPG